MATSWRRSTIPRSDTCLVSSLLFARAVRDYCCAGASASTNRVGHRSLGLGQKYQLLEQRGRHRGSEAIKLRPRYQSAMNGPHDARVLQPLKRNPDPRAGKFRITQPLTRHWSGPSPRRVGRYLALCSWNGDREEQHKGEDGPILATQDSSTLIRQPTRDLVVVCGQEARTGLDQNATCGS